MGHPSPYVTLYLFVPSNVHMPIYWSIAQHISGTVYQVITTFSTHVQNYDIRNCFFHFSQMSVFFDFLPEWKMKIAFIMYHVSGRVLHTIIIFGTLMQSYMSRCVCLFCGCFSKFLLSRMLRCERAKIGPNWQKIMFVTLHISGTIHHMIVIFGTHV